MKDLLPQECRPLEISEQDVLEAMRAIPGYLDITPGDFREIYQAAYRLAIKRLLDSLRAVDIMTRDVVVVEGAMKLIDAAALLAARRVSGAPVVDGRGRLVGVVSEKDFLKEMGFTTAPSFMQIAAHCLNERGCMIGRLHDKTIADIMSTPPVGGAPEMTIGAISSLFAARSINRLPIVDGEQRLVGIVTRSDLAHSFHVYQETMQR